MVVFSKDKRKVMYFLKKDHRFEELHSLLSQNSLSTKYTIERPSFLFAVPTIKNQKLIISTIQYTLLQ